MFDFELKAPVVLYARVSSDRQKERHTIDGQIHPIRRWAEDRGIHIAREFIDDGFNGDLPWMERPGANDLLTAAKNGEAHSVLLLLYDRFSREVYEGLYAARQLKASGCSPYSLMEPFDINTAFGKQQFINALNNAEYNKSTMLERMRIGLYRKAREGAYLGGVVPFGYRVDRSSRTAMLVLAEDPLPVRDDGLSEADIVRQMFAWLTDTDNPRSCVWIAEELTNMGVLTTYKSREIPHKQRVERPGASYGIWRASSVYQIVTNPMHKGIKVYGRQSNRNPDSRREIIEHPCPATVSAETWEAAAAALTKNRMVSSRNAKREYLLRRMIVCGICGLNYCGVNRCDSRGGAGSYSCNGNQSYYTIYGKDASKKCPSKRLNALDLEDRVWRHVVAIMLNPEEQIALMQSIVESRRADTDAQKYLELAQKELAEVETSIARLDAGRERLLTMYRRMMITDGDLELQLLAIGKEKDDLSQRVQALVKSIAAFEAIDTRLADATAEVRRMGDRYKNVLESESDSLTTAQKREIVEAVINKIVIETNHDSDQPDNARRRTSIVHIYYKFSTEGDVGAIGIPLL